MEPHRLSKNARYGK